MRAIRSPRARRLVLFGSLGAMAFFGAMRLVRYDPTPWGLVAAFAAGTALLAGPVAWVVRSRLPEERRENLGYVAGGLALLCVPAALGLGLLSGNLLLVTDAGVLGSVAGFAVATLVERLVVPARLRGAAR